MFDLRSIIVVLALQTMHVYKVFCVNLSLHIIYEPHHEKTGYFAYAKTKAQISFAVNAKLISAFVFATRIVQFLFCLNPKLQASSLLL